tara:strand:+ start:649 stop:1263 length:615 start_codon:yes stop_codon:yes gene_type:complete
MPKFQENKGFKMPGIGSKEKHTPGNFREEHHVDKMGYCDDTPLNMLPPGSSPVTFMGNEPLASSSDGSPLSYQWSLDDDPYTSVKYTPGSLDFSDAFGDDDKPPVESESNPDGKQKGNTNITNNYFSEATGGIDDNKETPREEIKVKTQGGKSMRQAYDDALRLGYRDADESFEDYSVRAKAHKDYGKGGKYVTISGKELKKEN